jgi:Uma2 family endonuclease
MNAPVLPKARMKVDEFLAWTAPQSDDRYELVGGEIVAMTRDTVRHNLTTLAAAGALQDAVRTARLPGVVFIDGIGVPIDERTLRMPDVLVQFGAEPDPDAPLVESPLIVVEVISPSSERDRTGMKLVDYFSVASIRHYLIIFSEKHVVVHHQRRDAGNIDTRIVHDGDIVLSPPGITVAVATLLGPPQKSGGA